MTEQQEGKGKKFDAFIKGEVIDLCVPTKEPWVIEQWYRWFNDDQVTPYLYQGMFPNTYEKQEKFYDTATGGEDRIVLLIRPKEEDYFVGVASLSFIDFKQRRCHFAMVMGRQDSSADSLFYAMETKCRMTEHAFENLGMERIQSEQVMDLIRWQKWQILFGYQIEGILRDNFRKGYRVWDTMMSSCLLEDYLKLKELREGSLWPGKSRLFELMKRLPKKSTIEKLVEWLILERQRNWEGLMNDFQG